MVDIYKNKFQQNKFHLNKIDKKKTLNECKKKIDQRDSPHL